MNKPGFSIVVPVFNGADTLKELFFRTRSVMLSMNQQFEMIFVDDGSTDSSWERILELKQEFGGTVLGIRLARNVGQQAATFCGLQKATGDWIVTIDDDLQIEPEEIPKLWLTSQSEQADLVYGTYPTVRHTWLHNIGSRIYRRLMSRIAPYAPGLSAFRLIRGTIVQSFPSDLRPWIFVDPALNWHTSAVATIPINQYPRRAGRSGYSVFRLLEIAIMAVLFHSMMPLKLMILFGFLSALVSFCLGVFFLIQKLVVGSVLGFSAMIVTITFGIGILLFCMGILGIYIARIYQMQIGQPAFTIKTIV
jgi:glycosyltransferase involved in cell wall biosynthesis